MDAFAAMLEVCMRVTHTSTPCRACGGQGFRELDFEEIAQREAKLAGESNWYERDHLRRRLARDTVCAVCHGSGYVRPTRADRRTAVDSMWTTVRCSSCRGAGHDSEGDSCPRCVGRGYRQTLTARPRGAADGVLHEQLDLELVRERPLPATLPEEVQTMPPYLRLSIVAKACKLSVDSTETLLTHLRLIERVGGGDYKHVRSERLRSELPEVYERIAQSGVLAVTRSKTRQPG